MEAQIRSGDSRQRLPVGTILDNFYRIEGEIGSGGFGITYRGRDTKLGLPVAIKEYFPAEVGNRDSTMSVHPLTHGQGDVFQWGREGFIREAQMLASFKHQGIVRVLRYFEAHNTAYMVLEFEEGPSLARWLDRLGRPPSQAEMDKLTTGLIDALEAIHQQRLVHRDIAPDNIIVRADGTPVLLDFGAARYEVAEASRAANRSVHTRSFAIVKAHYSPFEQRSTDTKLRGPWSDIYALGATLYRAVTGLTPPDSHDRMGSDSDPMLQATTVAKGSYRPGFLAAIDRAMLLKRQERPQSVAEFRAQAFATDSALSLVGKPAASQASGPTPQQDASAKSFSALGDHRSSANNSEPPRRSIFRSAAAMAGVGLVVGVGMWMLGAATRDARPPAPGASLPAGSTTPAGERRGERRDDRVANSSDTARQTEDANKAATASRERAEAQRKAAEEDLRRADQVAQDAKAARERAERDALAAQAAEARRRAEVDLRAAEEAQRQAEARRREAEEAQREAEARRREAEAKARIVPWPRFDRRWVKGDGYNTPPPVVANDGDCKAMCQSDLSCRMYEFYKPKRLCNLYVHQVVEPDAGDSIVGLKP